ncbi:uncharacterized protein BO97DRAFT_421939 [Aspergillus homomorphus CBS 101889]|uniref:Rhodopsin domain-containing protein n=1 Tax=Aspergillus homomorphus (strain CBS 101889) TaxID=1450537 RepID=A0A395I5U3_ASPHC|nr:hypothetical protein BO97DRAFT_421939 [Aspergillus homomorphus CBS 101889]RAL15146.1 hypothetical protein BO97DRAFT_421939 [Aspergillus homomorphus CBS 101889]
MNPLALIIQPSALKPPVFAAVASFLCALSACFIALRLWTNLTHLRKLYVDDYLSVLALLILIWNSVTFGILINALNSNPDDVTIPYLTRLVAVGIASGNSAIYSVKLPLLFMLIRTFGIKTWLRWTCLFLITFGTLGGLTTLLYAGISCSPDLHEPTTPFLVSCVSVLTDATIARGSLSLFIDVIVFILPLPIILKLKMPLRKRIGLAFAFATGLLAITASALGLYFNAAQSQASSTNFANALMFRQVHVVESAVVLMVSCTPCIHLFWNKHGNAFRSFLRLGGTAVSNATTTSSESHLVRSEANKDRIQVRMDQYIELEEGIAQGEKKPLYEARAVGLTH